MKRFKVLKSKGYKYSISVNAGIFETDDMLDSDLEGLEIEITENEMITNTKVLANRLKRLKNKILLDDFGTGYSSFKYLQDFRIDTMKLDLEFIKNINKNTIVLETIIYLAKRLNKEIIVEGVETEEQLKWCKSHGVYIIQGYYFDKPENLYYIINKYL